MAIVQVVVANELIVPSTPLPPVWLSLSRNERNWRMPFATSRLAAFSTARSRPFVAYSTSFVISIAKRKKIGETVATSYAVPDPRPMSPPSALYEPALPPGFTCNGSRIARLEIFSTSPRCWIMVSKMSSRS